MAKSLYEAIGVGRGATKEEIEAVCLELGEFYRVGHEAGDRRATKRFMEVSQAFETLCDAERRKAYDNELDLVRPARSRAGALGSLATMSSAGRIVLAAFLVVVLAHAAFRYREYLDRSVTTPPLSEEERKAIQRSNDTEAERRFQEDERKRLVDKLSDDEKRAIRRAYDSIRPDLRK